MTDRELLELAAKAAGIDLSGWDWRVNSFCRGYGITEDFESWNPLTDDGDALRLAVKLFLELEVNKTYVSATTPTGIIHSVFAEEVDDGYAATRRAIVRAAAEIGNNL